MNYPLISEYVEAIKSAEDNFEELNYLRPVLGDDGLPVMTSGNFAVVFKMKDIQSGKLYAIKCFTKEQEGRAESYRQIADAFNGVSTSYFTPIRYLEKELFVDSNNSNENEFPVLLMDWVDGKSLDIFVRQNLKRKKTMEEFLGNYYQLAKWLIAQPFAHGDLKPDNILVKKDGNIVLVDYDGMYVPAMKGQKSREVGSPDFCHPQRNEDKFDEHIDDFSILSILLSLCVLFVKPSYIKKYGAEDRLLFSKNDYVDIYKSNVFMNIPSIIETSTNYKSLFEKACKDLDFQLKRKSLTPINKLITAITLQKEAKKNLKNESLTRTEDVVNIKYLGISTDIEAIEPYYWDYPHHYHIDNTISQRDVLKKEKREKATKWQTALFINLTIVLLVTFVCINTNNRSDEMCSLIIGGAFGALIAWFFAFFDYIKRDGSFDNSLLAIILLPITMYYGFFCCISACINLFKEWKDKNDNY